MSAIGPCTPPTLGGRGTLPVGLGVFRPACAAGLNDVVLPDACGGCGSRTVAGVVTGNRKEHGKEREEEPTTFPSGRCGEITGPRKRADAHVQRLRRIARVGRWPTDHGSAASTGSAPCERTPRGCDGRCHETAVPDPLPAACGDRGGDRAAQDGPPARVPDLFWVFYLCAIRAYASAYLLDQELRQHWKIIQAEFLGEHGSLPESDQVLVDGGRNLDGSHRLFGVRNGQVVHSVARLVVMTANTGGQGRRDHVLRPPLLVPNLHHMSSVPRDALAMAASTTFWALRRHAQRTACRSLGTLTGVGCSSVHPTYTGPLGYGKNYPDLRFCVTVCVALGSDLARVGQVLGTSNRWCRNGASAARTTSRVRRPNARRSDGVATR